MLKERRLYPRQAINRVAKFQSGVGSLPRDCFVTDVSERGARLFADGVEIPDQFVLSMTGEAAIRKECRVVWRLGGELGVEFVDPRPGPVRRPPAESIWPARAGQGRGGAA